ncbi:TetR family transcriptional regulator [Pseudoroseomonas deserti]|uniref:TetR family transcriptional regulator n=1 Tax=Teichococcus deserti TaxID=1817963 RepID=A0A1V2H5A3_9PROT|nr:TetR/AcrR family transcriptional regulator [Pseudoroseomonas deserti]ONG55862.1 TetR family transcriptional regulator [Pseudoroseomonas deserti]
MARRPILRRMTLPAARGRPRSAASTAAILEAAYALMAGQGLAATGIDAVARAAQVSKMTIYKWWPTREALLIDAFLHQAAARLPLLGEGSGAARLRRHVADYVAALDSDFGRVQRAVIAECIAGGGSAAAFFERYLAQRRAALARIIAEGQADGSILSDAAPAAIYDALYGGLFYRHLFGMPPQPDALLALCLGQAAKP